MVGRGLGLGGRLQRRLHPRHHLQHHHRVQRHHQQVSPLQLQLCRRYALTQVRLSLLFSTTIIMIIDHHQEHPPMRLDSGDPDPV